jgi:prolipoprotein diacylglyceryltransferase
MVFYGLIAAILILIQLNYSKSPLLHIATSIVIFLVCGYYFSFWQILKNGSEAIANSWKEWVIGKVRVINHGFYVGMGAFLGIFIAGILAGRDYAWTILLFAIIVITFSALWAQLIEGSEKLKRPYGYYGALVGIIFASMAVWAVGHSVWITIGAITVVMPWVQAMGRLRCLINGCCHGARIDNPRIGIRYYHFRSRVCGLSDMKGEWLHPTPLYSIIWLTLVGFVLLAMWRNGLSSPFIFGIYLMLTGIGRFVEEAYRGEIQTPIYYRLRLYQWTAMLSVLIGIGMTFIRIDPPAMVQGLGWETWVAALLGGIFTTFAMGIDFPYSNARFSRLV